jgi:GT2 family glycosyltransferase
MAASVAAVVLNYDGRALLDVIMPSLERQTLDDLKVLVVDNGSRDGSADYVRERWPSAELLVLPDNVGVAAALNRGLHATRGFEYVALLNNDLELEPDYLELLVQTLERHPEAGSATGKMLNFHDRERFDGAGDVFMWSSAATHRGYGERDEGQYDRAEPVFSPCAGAAVYRQTAFERVGGFEEDFFAYLEDVDWGLRAQLAGLTARYEPRAVAFHMGGATTQSDRRRYDTLQRRNQIWLVVKDYPAGALLRHGGKVLLHQGGWIVAAARDGMLRQQLAAVAAALRGLPRMLRKRRAVQRTVRVPLSQLDAIVTPEPYAGQSAGERARSIAAELATLLRR